MCDKNRLSAEELIHSCDPEMLGFETTADVTAVRADCGPGARD